MNTISTPSPHIPQDEASTRLARTVRYVGPLLLLVALWLLYHLLEHHSYREIEQAVRSIPEHCAWQALGFVVLNYLVLTGYDCLALRSINVSLAFPRVALTSFISYTFSYNLGFALLSGGAVRYRFYSSWGLKPAQIAHVIGFGGSFFWLGLCLLGSLALIIDPSLSARSLHLGTLGTYLLSIGLIAPLLLVIVMLLRNKTTLSVRKFHLTLPGLKLTLAALVIACLDWILSGSTLYLLMPKGLAVHFPNFLAIFLVAQLAAVVSHVPGGLGVFEATMLGLIQQPHLNPAILAALLVYRTIFYLFPFLIGVLLLVGYEVRLRTVVFRGKVTPPIRAASIWVGGVIAIGLAFATFIAGALLMFSGSVPLAVRRIPWLSRAVPLPLLELSHFMSSLVGMLLLILAWGIYKRVDIAYRLTVVALSAAVLLSLPKRGEISTALYLAILLVALWPCRHHFRRKAAAFSGFNLAYLAAVFCVLAVTVWLGFFSYKHVGYSHQLWWEFALDSDAPRFLRASAGMFVLMVFVSGYHLLRPQKPTHHSPTTEELVAVRRIIEGQESTQPALALLGDKNLLFNDPRSSFIMYANEGRSWVALGDPVGEPEEQRELVWEFIELSDAHDGWPVFYQASAEHIHLYLDVGMRVIKLGEEARVPLSNFSLEGSQWKGLRNTIAKLERAQIEFSVIPAHEVPALLPQLKHISDQWLAQKNVREKCFSVGFFNNFYLSQFPVALVRQQGTIIAFANLLAPLKDGEISIDLMRHAAEMPNGTMDYLFTKLMLWGKEQGFKTFSLGIAPLSGLDTHHLAPLWNRVGNYLFRHGEHFYNFEGLREYKEKFHPEWVPRYLAYPAKAPLPRILINTAALISGGLTGLVRR